MSNTYHARIKHGNWKSPKEMEVLIGKIHRSKCGTFKHSMSDYQKVDKSQENSRDISVFDFCWYILYTG